MIAVVVDVAVANAGTILVGSGNAGTSGDVHERELAGLSELVRVEAVRSAGAVGHIDVEVPVTIEIEHGDAGRAPRLNWRGKQVVERIGVFGLE
jgi:hypothetical protein